MSKARVMTMMMISMMTSMMMMVWSRRRRCRARGVACAPALPARALRARRRHVSCSRAPASPRVPQVLRPEVQAHRRVLSESGAALAEAVVVGKARAEVAAEATQSRMVVMMMLIVIRASISNHQGATLPP